MDIKEITLPARTYLIWRKEIDTKNIMDQTMWQAAFGKVFGYIRQNNLKPAGAGVALYFRWDEPKGKGEIGIGSPVESADKVTDPDLSVVSMPESKAAMTAVHGAYNEFPESHASLSKYIKDHGYEDTFAMEEYIVTGKDKPDKKDWETNIYHLFK